MAGQDKISTGWNKASSRIPALPDPTILATELSLRTFLALVDVDSIIAIFLWGLWSGRTAVPEGSSGVLVIRFDKIFFVFTV